MAILNYITVNSGPTPMSQDSSSSSSSVKQPTKIILPKKKSPKWSTGVAPGEYGGPPTTTKLRKYWGGEKDDPLTSSDLIWNRDFMSRMQNLVQDNTTQSQISDSIPPIQENQSTSMEELSVSLKSLSSVTPLKANNVIANAQRNNICKIKNNGIMNQDHPEKGNLGDERNIDLEIEEIEKEINVLSSRLECLRLEKAKRNAKMVEKRGRVVSAKFMDPPKQSIKSSNEQSKIEDSISLSAKMKTPKRGVSMGPNEIIRQARRGISLGPTEIYSATKMSKQEMITPVQKSANRRKSCYWKLHDVDELRITKERGKSLSLSPKARSKTVSKAPVPKQQAATTVGVKKTAKKEDAVKELRKRSLPENEEASKRSDKKRVSLVEKCQGGEQLGSESRMKKRWEIPNEGEQLGTESSRVKKRWEIPNEVMIQKNNVDQRTPLSVSKMLDFVPKIKNLRCVNESPRDSGAAKRVSELVGRKSFFGMEDDIDEEVEESVCQVLSFAEEQVIEEFPKIKVPPRIDESPRDSGAVKRVSHMESSGFLSLNRAMSLDSLEVDLSATLQTTPKPALEQENETTKNLQVPTQKWKLAPTNVNWINGQSNEDVILRETSQPRGDPEVLAAQSREQYFKLKNKLQLLNCWYWWHRFGFSLCLVHSRNHS
ncbi:hypothetical protein RDABS01_034338 [Bienertia sinuspersici]